MNFPHKDSRASSAKQTLVRRSFLSGVAFVALSLAACTRQADPAGPLQTEENAPSVLFDAIDTSSSARHALPTVVNERGALVLDLDEEVWLSTFRFDSEVRELRSAPVPNTDEAFLKEATPALSPLSGRDHTYFDHIAGTIARRAAKCQGRCVVVLATDGYGEGMAAENHKAVEAAARSMADNPRVAAVFVEGVDPRNMAQVRKDLAPLSKKLRFVPLGGLDRTLVASFLRAEGGQ